MENGNEVEPIDVDESDAEDPIEEEQLDEYREMVQNLGVFPVSRFGREKRWITLHTPCRLIFFL
jgi:hypothetical protein